MVCFILYLLMLKVGRIQARVVLAIQPKGNYVFDLCDRVMVIKNGKNLGSFKIKEVTKDDTLSLIIIGKLI